MKEFFKKEVTHTEKVKVGNLNIGLFLESGKKM
jgi:hypothetical protein